MRAKQASIFSGNFDQPKKTGKAVICRVRSFKGKGGSPRPERSRLRSVPARYSSTNNATLCAERPRRVTASVRKPPIPASSPGSQSTAARSNKRQPRQAQEHDGPCGGFGHRGGATHSDNIEREGVRGRTGSP